MGCVGKTILKHRYAFNFLICVIISYAALPSCLPIPNYWILTVPICFAILTTAAIAIHDYEIDLDYMYSKIINKSIKLMKIKLEYDIWFKSFLSILTGYSVIAVTYYPNLPNSPN